MIAQGETSAELSRVLERIAAMAPKGFGLGAHVGIGVGLARFFRMTYPKRWLDIYQSHSLVLMDPTICWAMSRPGPRAGVRSRCPTRSRFCKRPRFTGCAMG